MISIATKVIPTPAKSASALIRGLQRKALDQAKVAEANLQPLGLMGRLQDFVRSLIHREFTRATAEARAEAYLDAARDVRAWVTSQRTGPNAGA